MNKLSILIIIVSGSSFLFSCGSEETQKAERIRPVKTVVVGGANGLSGEGYPAVTKESKESEMAFRIGGPIIKYNVVEGAKVKKGDLIAEIDPRDFLVTLKSAQARNDQAKAESDRYYNLWKKGSVAKNDYDRKYADAQEAASALQDAKNALKDTKLRAPYSGFYGPQLAQVGDNVRQKKAITTIVDLTVLEVTTTIPEQMAIQLKNFESYQVSLEAYPDIIFNATLKNLEKKSTPEGYPLHLYLDHINKENDSNQPKVGAGMSCRVNIALKDDADKMARIIIPITAIFEDVDDKVSKVWIISQDSSTVSIQAVKVGNMVGHDGIEIMEGLENGQTIVAAGVHRLHEGDKVNNVNILVSK